MFTVEMIPLSKAKQKWIRSLHLKKNRDAEMLFLVEGEKSVLEGLTIYPEGVHTIIVKNTDTHLIPQKFHHQLFTLTESELSSVSSLKTPNKLLAIFKRQAHFSPQVERAIVLDGVQDPGNLGTIIRLADWFGIKQIICSKDTVDCFNQKVIQASMGSLFRVQIFYTDLVDFLSTTQQIKYAALLDGAHYKQVNFEKNALLIMGNEGKGIRPDVLKTIDKPITIPRIGEAESLNVATATAILLAEMSL